MTEVNVRVHIIIFEISLLWYSIDLLWSLHIYQVPHNTGISTHKLLRETRNPLRSRVKINLSLTAAGNWLENPIQTKAQLFKKESRKRNTRTYGLGVRFFFLAAADVEEANWNPEQKGSTGEKPPDGPKSGRDGVGIGR